MPQRGHESRVLRMGNDSHGSGVNQIEFISVSAEPTYVLQAIVLNATYAITGYYSQRMDLKRKEKSGILPDFRSGFYRF